MANCKELFERLNSDSEFAAKFSEAVQAKRDAGASNYYETIIPVAADLGYEVTPEELDEINETSGDGSISDEELGKVAGGTSCMSLLIPVTIISVSGTVTASIVITADEIRHKK